MTRNFDDVKNGIKYEIAKLEHYKIVKHMFLHDYLEREPLVLASGHGILTEDKQKL